MADIGKHGGHDAVALIGAHPFLKPIDIYRKHTEGWQQEQTERMEEGVVFEPAILDLYKRRTGAELLPGGVVQHATVPWAVATLDSRANRDGETRVVDAKHPSIYTIRDWSEDSESPPIYIAGQMTWYLGITGMAHADVPTYFGGSAFRIYSVAFDAELFAMMMDAVAKFRRDHLDKRVPPPPDDSEQYTKFLRTRYPESGATYLQATPDLEQWVRELREAEAARDAAASRYDAAKNHIIAAIADNKGVEGNGWRIGLPSVKGREKVDTKAVFRALGATAETIAAFTTRGAPYRRFSPSWKRKKEGEDD